MDYNAAENLTRLMHWSGISQKELAKRIGVTAPAVSAWQRGLRTIPEGRIDAICDVLNCSRSQLFDHSSEPSVISSNIVIAISGLDYSGYPYIYPGDKVRVRREADYDLSREALYGISIAGRYPRVAYVSDTPDGILVRPINRPEFQPEYVRREDLNIIGLVTRITRTVKPS